MGVTLGSRQTRVAEKFLDRPKVRTTFQYVGGRGVTQRMRGNPRYLSLTRQPLQASTNDPWVKAAAFGPQEQSRARRRVHQMISDLQPRLEGLISGRPEWHNSNIVPLAGNPGSS